MREQSHFSFVEDSVVLRKISSSLTLFWRNGAQFPFGAGLFSEEYRESDGVQLRKLGYKGTVTSSNCSGDALSCVMGALRQSCGEAA